MAFATADILSISRSYATWPEEEQSLFAAWLAGERHLTQDAAPPRRLSSAINYARGYTNCRRWAERIGRLKPGDELSDVFTSECVQGYAREQFESGYAPSKVRLDLISLDRVWCAFYPEADRRIINRIVKLIPRRGECRGKGDRLQDTLDIVQFSKEYLDEILASPVCEDAAMSYRNGFQTALLALRPYRLGVFTEFEFYREGEVAAAAVGPFLTCESGKYWLNYRAPHHASRLVLRYIAPAPHGKSKMKGGKFVPARQEFPGELVTWLEPYLYVYRPVLCGLRYNGRRLWVSRRHAAQSGISIYKDIVALTNDAFDRPIYPHLFRDCYATSLSRRSPDQRTVSHRVLGNSERMVSDTYEQTDLAQLLEIGRRASVIMDGYLVDDGPACTRL